MNTIRILVKEPGKDFEERIVENALSSFNEIVGGYIDAFVLPDVDLAIFFNEEGRLLNLPINMSGIVGPLFVVRRLPNGDEGSLRDDDIAYVKRWLASHIVR